jgi:translocation and assembly module TamA
VPTLPRNGDGQHRANAQLSGISGTDRRYLLVCLVVLLCAWLPVRPCHAADPQTYKVDMASTGDSDMNATLKATSDLITLRSSAPVGPFGLIGRARSDLGRLKTVLESYGYYQSYVAITIDGLAVDDPTLGDKLGNKVKGDDARVKITFSIGPLYHLRQVEIDGDIPPELKSSFDLKSGAPAVAAEVLAAGDRLQTALEDEGYAFAKVDPPVAQEIPADRVLDVSFHVTTGAKVQIGAIRFRGLKRMRESFVRQRLLVHQGELYGASKVERARKDLLALGVFTSVTVQMGNAADNAGQVPMTFRVRERLLHAVSLNAAYSTDLGGSSGVTWTHRDLSGKADQLILNANVLNLGGTASTGIGYDVGAKYLLPDFGHRDQTLQLAVQALNQSLEAYDQRAITFGATLTRKLSSLWSVSAGVTAEVERIGQEGFYAKPCLTTCPPDLAVPPAPLEKFPSNPPDCTATSCTVFTQAKLTSHYELFALPLSITYNTTGLDSPIEDATHGIRASLSETPTLSVGTRNAKFFITQASVSFYLDLHDLKLNPDPGRSVIALRALGGLAQGAGQYSLPPDQRFYAGGSGTIRGYKYQAVGPVFPVDGNPIGGTAINAGTLEFRQRIGRSLGFAVFMDAGQVSQNVNPLDSTLRFGAGAGVRYYTPIGPIRLDVAVPINRRRACVTTPADSPFTAPCEPIGPYIDDAFEIYIGLGQAF